MKADIQKILLTGEDRPDLYSVHRLQDVAPEVNPKIVAEFHGRPINYPVGGGFEACELELLPEQVWEFEYVNRKNNFTSYFNDRTDPQNPTLASFEIINSQGVARWINYKMYGITGASQGIPEGNTITYNEVFSGIDLRYIVNTWRLKEDIIINQPVERYAYKFTLKLDPSIVMEPQEDGSIDFVDVVTGERLWGIAKPYAKDADDKETWGVRYILGKELYNGVEYDSIEIIIDDTEFVQNATFPIVIDPTTSNYNVSASGDDGCVINDCSLPISIGSLSLDLTDSQLEIRKDFYSSTEMVTHTIGLLRFNTSSIPDDVDISLATLKLYCGLKDDSGRTARNLNCEYYSFSSITTAAYLVADLSITAFSLNKTAFVQGTMETIALSNLGNISKTGYTGFRMGLTGQGFYTGGNDYVRTYFNSFNNTENKPIMTATYNVPPTAPIITGPDQGEVWNQSHTITWTASTDPDGDALQYNIDLSIDGGATYPYQIASLTAAGATSQLYDFSSIPASTNCKLRIRAYDGAVYGTYAYSGVFTIQHITDMVNIDNVWKEEDSRYCNINGAWKEIDTIFGNIGGVWKTS